MRTLLASSLLLACSGPSAVMARPEHLRIDVPTSTLLAPVDALASAPDVLAWVPLSDGARATLRADGSLTLDARGRTLEALSVQHPERCSLAPWKLRAIAFCPDNGREPASLEDVTLPRLLALRGEATRWIPSRDGRTLTRPGACAPVEGAEDTALVACSLDSDGRWREWRTDAPGALIDRYGDLAIARRCTEGAQCAVALFDINLARWRPLLLPDTAARWVRVGFDADGRVVALVHTGTRDVTGWFVSGPPDASMRAVRLPEPVDDAATDGPDRAVFLHGSEAWSTADGALTLRPIRRPAPGAVTAPRDPSPGRLGENASCASGRCVIARIFEASF